MLLNNRNKLVKITCKNNQRSDVDVGLEEMVNSITFKIIRTMSIINNKISLEFIYNLKSCFQPLMMISLNIRLIKPVKKSENTFNSLKTIIDLLILNRMLNLSLKQQEYLVKELKNNLRN